MSEIIKNYCNSCKRPTNHKDLATHTISSDPQEYHFSTKYMIVQCLGCDRTSYRREEHDYEVYWQTGEDDWEHEITITSYPNFLKHHNPITDRSDIPETVCRIYDESIIAIQEEAYTLAGLGLRATIESICNEQNITGRDLQQRINKMQNQGLISKKDAQRLHSIRFLGNDAAHEIKKATKASVLIALTIIEHILLTLYVLDKEVNRHLETTINTLDDLLKILQIKMNAMTTSETISLKKWLGKDQRRILENYQTLETSLVEYIQSLQLENVEYIAINNASGELTHGYKITIPEVIDEEEEMPF